MAPPTKEIGSVATWSQLAFTGGVGYDEGEECPDLRWPSSISVYDAMRRRSQVRAVLWALTLPMRRDIWALDPQGAPPEVVSALSEDLDLPVIGAERIPKLRTRGRFSWNDHLRLALLSLTYGHMPFEMAGEVVDGKWRLRKLAPRFPQTLTAINVARDGGLLSIEQSDAKAKGGFITIPVDRLVFYVIDREGGSWAGSSVLRAAYGDWLIHDRLMRVNAQTIERNGMGVPMIEAQEGATQNQIDEYQLLAQAYRAGERSGGALPAGARLRLVGVEGTLPDALPTLNYHDTQIAKSVQAEFMQLGTNGSSGNRALGGTFVDVFATAVDGLAAQIADVATAHIVEDIVDWNYGPGVAAPKVVARPVDADQDLPVEALTALVKTGAIAMDDELENWLRHRYRMPARGTGPARPVPNGDGNAPTVAASAAAPTPRPRPVAASAPGSEPYAEELAGFYAPRVARHLGAATDTAAIVAAYEANRVGAAEAAQRQADDRMQWTTLIAGVSAIAAREPATPTINVAAPSVTVTPPSVVVEAPQITVETPAVSVTLPGQSPPQPAPKQAKARRIERDKAGNIIRIVEEN